MEDIIEALLASFAGHQEVETVDVTRLLEGTPEVDRGVGGVIHGRTRVTASGDLLLGWPNPDPGILAAHMALWGSAAPTRTHPLQIRHPQSQLIRSFYHSVDRYHDWRGSHTGWPRLR